MTDLNHLAGINLNLLLSLKALLTDRSVSIAADHLNITQPSMSRNLCQLREFFQDQLLVRSGKDYILTPRGQNLAEKLDVVIDSLNTLVSDSFLPSTHAMEFVISAPDYVIEKVLGEVMAFLFGMDGKIQFRLVNWDTNAKNMLIAGNVHLAVSIDNKFPQNIYRRQIDVDYPVCVTRKGHPLTLKEHVTLQDFLSYYHVSVITGGGWESYIDKPLRELGEKRNVKLIVPSYGAAFAALKYSNLMAVVPCHVAVNSLDEYPLHIFEVPFEVEKLTISLWWHERHHNDAAHKWMREELFPRLLTHPKQLGISAKRCAAALAQ
jgi:DNA-binding transcriptional LysR family regulator